MKFSRSETRSKAHALPEVRFESQALTSFAGLVLIQKFFAAIDLKAQLSQCFCDLQKGKVFHRATLFVQLIVHLLLGYRELQDCRYYEDDPLVKRVLGLQRLPDVATLSRALKEATAQSVENLRRFLKDRVLACLVGLSPARVTLDFDGSVQSTKRHAEGTAVGYNKKKKGARSYYPLFCTVAQTGQVLNFLHRPGNVHDSNGAKAFILACLDAVHAAVPGAILEVRMDSAFFSDEIVQALAQRAVEFTLSVPFERFVELKGLIEARQHWRRVDTQTLRPRRVAAFHEGRGSQEGVFGELKSHCHLDYVPVRTLYGNQTYLLAGLFAYNLLRELQMQTRAPSRR